MVSPYVKAEITAAVTNLGYLEGNKYYKEKYCVEALKDLIRFLRKDDSTFAIRRELGQMKVVTLHLLPIICDYHNDNHLFDVALRLMLNLTNPTLLLYNEELPSDKVHRNQYLQIVSHLQSYKPTLASSKLWNILTDKLKVLLVKEPEERLEDDRLVTERILILIRNILDIPITPDDEKRTDDDASVHDTVLWSMHQSGLEDVIVYLASNENERPYCMHVMEIISLMLREQNPINLANAAAQRSVVEQKKETDELVNLVQKETADREARYRKMTGSRSSIFRGTFCVKDVKSISEKELIVHKSTPDMKSINFSSAKQPKKKPQNRLPLQSADGTRRSTLAIRLMLKEFCIEILNGAYNTLMHTVKDCLVRMRTQEHDETYYLWAMKFFMEFNRSGKFKVELVTETVSVGIFHYIQTLVDKYSEMIVVDKKKVASWSKRLHMAVRAYQELLMTISAMDRYGNDQVKRSSRILKSNIFYVLEYREMCLVLLQNYKETQHSISYLKDLVETTHIFLKLFESHTQGTKHFMIQKKVRARKKKAKRSKSKEGYEEKAEETTENTTPPPEFEEIAAEITEVLHQQPELPDGMRPYDPLCDSLMDDQKMAALNKIQKLLKETKIPVAVAYLRASREVWPEGEVFGALDIRPEEELLLLREIFYAALPEAEDEKAGSNEKRIDEDEDGEDEGDEIEEEEMAAERRTSEEELHFDEFVRRFAHCKIVQAYCSLLRRYATNSTLTNHCLVKMLHRVAFDCKMPTMLYQLSLFKTFQTIMADPKAKVDQSIKELGKFGAYIVRKFAEASHANPKIFVELLFWKTARDAAEIDACYGDVQDIKSNSRNVWAEEEEDELQRLYEEFREIQDPERDLVDRIMANMIRQDRSRRLVIKKLKDMGLISGAKDLAKTKTVVRVRPPKEWAQNEITELRRIFEEVRDSSDPLSLLIDRLPVQRSKKRVRDKIIELGLVADAKELRRKRSSAKGRKSIKANLYDSDADEENVPPREGGASDYERFTSEDDTDSESDKSVRSDDESKMDVEFRKLKKQKHKKKKITKRKQYGFGASNADSFKAEALNSTLRQLLDSGRRGGLDWVMSSLREAFADRMDDEDDGRSEAIPLVPVDNAAVAAMEDHIFLKFVAEMGLAPPANEQEQYWRIPISLTAPHLRKRIDFLEKALEGSEEMGVKFSSGENPGGVSLRACSRSSNESGKRSATPPPSSNRKRRRIVQSDSESESDAVTLASLEVSTKEITSSAEAELELPKSTALSSTVNRKKFTIVESDSE